MGLFIVPTVWFGFLALNTPLIAELGSPDFRQRDAATQQLKLIGVPMAERLKQVVEESRNPEQVRRAKEVLAHVDAERARATLLEPMRVQLPAGKTTVGQALQSLNLYAQLRFAVLDPKLLTTPITLPKTETLPFWKAIRLLETAADMTQTDPPTTRELTYVQLPESERAIRRQLLKVEESRAIRNLQPLEKFLKKRDLTPLERHQHIALKAALHKVQEKTKRRDPFDQRWSNHLPTIVFAKRSPSVTVGHNNVGAVRISLYALEPTASKFEHPFAIQVFPEPGTELHEFQLFQINRADDRNGNDLTLKMLPQPEIGLLVVNRDTGIRGKLHPDGRHVVVCRGVPFSNHHTEQMTVRIEEHDDWLFQPQWRADTHPMFTLASRDQREWSLGQLHGMVRMRVSRSHSVLQEIDVQGRSLHVGDATGDAVFAIAVTRLADHRGEYKMEFNLNYQSSEVDYDNLDRSVPNDPQVAALRRFRNGGPDQEWDVKLYDTNGQRFENLVSMRKSYTAKPYGMIHETIKVVFRPDRPDQGPPARFQVIGTRNRFVTIPFDFGK